MGFKCGVCGDIGEDDWEWAYCQGCDGTYCGDYSSCEQMAFNGYPARKKGDDAGQHYVCIKCDDVNALENKTEAHVEALEQVKALVPEEIKAHLCAAQEVVKTTLGKRKPEAVERLAKRIKTEIEEHGAKIEEDEEEEPVKDDDESE